MAELAEGARLESVFRLTPNEGSNPSLTAIYEKTRIKRVFSYMAVRNYVICTIRQSVNSSSPFNNISQLKTTTFFRFTHSTRSSQCGKFFRSSAVFLLYLFETQG